MRYVFIFLLLYCGCILAQRYQEPDKIKQFNIIVNQDEQTVKTQILKNPKKIQVNNEATYLWYTNNKLVETAGGYDGKLLHGYYRAFFFSNQLKESGEIRYGLKNGEWRYWYSSGLLREVITWKKGHKNGFYAIYNDQGKMMARGRFKNDLLDGKFYTYDKLGKVLEKKKYKNGNEVVEQPRIKNRKVNKRPQYNNDHKVDEGSADNKPKKSRKSRPDSRNEEQKPQQDSTKKENFFERIFKKKKHEPQVETTPTNTQA